MNKISKQKLKQIVKECIVEILAEGLGNELVEGVSRVKQHAGHSTGHGSSIPSRPALVEAVKEVAAGDKVLTGILADTAATTFQQQSKYSKPNGEPLLSVGGGKEELAVAAVTPQEMFGSEVMSKWEDLAFAPSAKKLR
jgi:hypothetical protein